MATIERDGIYEGEEQYWKMVEQSLVKVFGVARPDAQHKISELRKNMENASAEERVLSFHNEPLDIAADLLDRRPRPADIERYQAIVQKLGWSIKDNEVAALNELSIY